METDTDRDLGDFWKVQAQLAQTLQLDIARTLQAKRLHGEPTAPLDLERLAMALARAGEAYDVAFYWQRKAVE